MVSGVALGIAGTLVLVFALFAAVDSRYVTRREHAVTMKDIQRQLDQLNRFLGNTSPDRD